MKNTLISMILGACLVVSGGVMACSIIGPSAFGFETLTNGQTFCYGPDAGIDCTYCKKNPKTAYYPKCQKESIIQIHCTTKSSMGLTLFCRAGNFNYKNGKYTCGSKN